MENTNEELKPCPFCGGAAEARSNGAVCCDTVGCGAEIWTLHADASAKRWNRRAAPAAGTGTIEDETKFTYLLTTYREAPPLRAAGDARRALINYVQQWGDARAEEARREAETKSAARIAHLTHERDLARRAVHVALEHHTDAAAQPVEEAAAQADGDHYSQNPQCSCPSGSGSLHWPCVIHPPAAVPTAQSAPLDDELPVLPAQERIAPFGCATFTAEQMRDYARAALRHPPVPNVGDALRRSKADTDYHGRIAFTPDQFKHFVALLTGAAPNPADEDAPGRLRALYEAVGQVMDGEKELNITRLHDYLGGEIGLPVEAVLCDAAECYQEPADEDAATVLAEMVKMMDENDEHGAGSDWHTRAKAALAARAAAAKGGA